MTRVSTGFKLSEKAKNLLEQLAEESGVSQTAVMERAIRDLARRELPPAPPAATTEERGEGGKG